MDKADFDVSRIKELLAIHEAAIADLVTNGAPEEAVRRVRQRRDCYAQYLNMTAGPLTFDGKKKGRQRCW